VPQIQTYVVATIVGHDQVEGAVATKVGKGRRYRMRTSGKRALHLKGSVAVAQQQAHRVVFAVDDCQVDPSVIVEIAKRNRCWTVACRECLLSLEGAVAVTQ